MGLHHHHHHASVFIWGTLWLIIGFSAVSTIPSEVEWRSHLPQKRAPAGVSGRKCLHYLHISLSPVALGIRCWKLQIFIWSYWTGPRCPGKPHCPDTHRRIRLCVMLRRKQYGYILKVGCTMQERIGIIPPSSGFPEGGSKVFIFPSISYLKIIIIIPWEPSSMSTLERSHRLAEINKRTWICLFLIPAFGMAREKGL